MQNSAKLATLFRRKQVDKQAVNAQTLIAAVYRKPKPNSNGFDYSVEVIRSEQGKNGAMADVEKLSIDAARIDSLIQELLAAQDFIKNDIANLTK
jgi:hypothetical protein